jgi:hypothetical protein
VFDAVVRVDVKSTKRFSWAITIGTSEYVFTASNEADKASWCKVLSGDDGIMNVQTLKVDFQYLQPCHIIIAIIKFSTAYKFTKECFAQNFTTRKGAKRFR